MLAKTPLGNGGLWGWGHPHCRLHCFGLVRVALLQGGEWEEVGWGCWLCRWCWLAVTSWACLCLILSGSSCVAALSFSSNQALLERCV